MLHPNKKTLDRKAQFQKIGRALSVYEQAWQERAGISNGTEYVGTVSFEKDCTTETIGKDKIPVRDSGGSKVLQLVSIRDRGIRAIQKRLGLEPESE